MTCPIPGTISPMSGFWAMFWLAVVMKIPIVALLLIVWWAIREPPVPEADDDRGGSDRDPRHPRRRPPRPPRRGPHHGPAPGTPARVRLARVRRRVPAMHR
jgi:hypothetical protein